MKNVWLFHINPDSSFGHSHGWTLEYPKTILKSKDRTWSSHHMCNKVAVGDVICVYMKNIGDMADGVYVVGNVTDIDPKNAEFTWRPDPKRSARTLVAPIGVTEIRKFFPRSYGASMQPLDPGKRSAWLKLIGEGEVTDGVPCIKAKGKPRSTIPPLADPQVSVKHGKIGEAHVMKILRERHKETPKRKVVHISAKDPGADHDIEVVEGKAVLQLVEVKTCVGKTGAPVIISEREMQCRRDNRKRHWIFVVYLNKEEKIRDVVEIGPSEAFELKPRQHWLFPGTA